jgi:hypothetical protein
MSVGIWITPALLAGLFLIFWVTTWLERLVTPPDFAPEFGMPEAADPGFADSAARPLSLGMDRQLGANAEANRPKE